ncbi:MAG: sensor histidine kinase, partial [Nitrospiraceae bacterium]
MNYFKKDSLRKSLVLSLIVLSIAPLLLVGIILSWQDVRVLKLQAKDSQKKLTMLVANKMSSFIHEFEASLLTAVRTHDLMEMKHDKQSLVHSKMLFSSMDLEHRDVFKGLTLLNSEGKELVRVSRERLFTDAQLADRSSIDEFTIPAANKKIYYSTVFFNEQTGEPYLEVSIPIIDFQSNQLRGVLVAELSMKNLWDAIADVRVGTTGITYVLSDKGRVIAHPNPSVVLKGTYFKLPKANGVVTGLQGKKSYMVIDTLMFGNQSLKIVTELPVSEALHYAFLALYIIVGFLIISLMGAVSLGYILVRQIVQPIESLSGTAQLISKGDFSQRMHVSRTDEIGALADAFNTMTSQLIDTINSLKKEIDERKQIENQVLQQNELLNNILNSLSHPFYVIDTSDYTIKLANEAAHFGELAGDPKCYMLTHKNDEPCSGDEHP